MEWTVDTNNEWIEDTDVFTEWWEVYSPSDLDKVRVFRCDSEAAAMWLRERLSKLENDHEIPK